MKWGTAVLLLLVSYLFASSGAHPADASRDALAFLQSNAHQYNKEWADALGADKIGMRKYVIAYLKKGSKRDHSPEEAARIQREHMENITKLAEEGKLILAGPFMDDGDIRGIFVFDVEDLDKAREWTATDPAIQAGRLEMELHPWYGSASLRLTPSIHKIISQQKP